MSAQETRQASDSGTVATQFAEKLALIKMPKNLEGKRVLDLGCGEGDFCREAKRRGAAEVIGIDEREEHIDRARSEAAAAGFEIDFRVGAPTALPEGEFDVILALSTLHHLTSPALLLASVREKLAPRGTLILETGVDRNNSMLGTVRALCADGEIVFPTERLLREVWLEKYSVRLVGPGLDRKGDPIPRVVYHCTRAFPNIILVHGAGKSGKSTLARQLNCPIVSVDHFLRPKRVKDSNINDAQRLIDAELEKSRSIKVAWGNLSRHEEVRSYLSSEIANAAKQCVGAETIIIEGYIIKDLVDQIKANLGPGFQTWELAPI